MDHDERRSSTRYEPGRSAILVGWHDQGSFEVTQGRILNLSMGGLAVAASDVPMYVRAAWVKPPATEEGPPDWVSVAVVEIRETGCADQWFGMKFAGACPYELFKHVIFSSSARTDTRSDLAGMGSQGCSERAAAIGPVAAQRPEAPLPDAMRREVAVIDRTALNGNHLRTALTARRRVCGGPISVR